MVRQTITKRQKQIYDFIVKYQDKQGYAPSLKEIADKFNFTSPSTAHFHVASLHEAGYIEKSRHKARAITAQGGYRELEPVIHKKTASQAKAGQLPLDQIILGDAVMEMKRLPANSCDIIIIDPPYNIGKDFGNNKDKRDLKEYVRWSKQWIKEAMRLLKPGGTMFIYGFSEILAYLSIEIPLDKRWLIWHYTNKNVASLNFWQRSHEAIICAWKGKPVFNRDEVREPYTEGFLAGAAGKVRKGTPGRFSSNGQATIYNAHAGGALPRDVIKVPALAGGAGMGERWFLCRDCHDAYQPKELSKHIGHKVLKHPTQKPLQLTRKLIKSAAPGPEALVLVPFAGTGSECVAAKELGHHFIGYELNPDYIKLANKFISSVPPRLF